MSPGQTRSPRRAPGRRASCEVTAVDGREHVRLRFVPVHGRGHRQRRATSRKPAAPRRLAVEVDEVLLPHRARVLADLLLAHLVLDGWVGLSDRLGLHRHGAAVYVPTAGVSVAGSAHRYPRSRAEARLAARGRRAGRGLAHLPGADSPDAARPAPRRTPATRGRSPRQLAQAGRLVDQVADHRVLEALLGEPTLPATAGPADTPMPVGASKLALDALAQGARRAARRRRVGPGDRRAEDAQGGVALELVHPAAVLLHHLDHEAEEARSAAPPPRAAAAAAPPSRVDQSTNSAADLALLAPEGHLAVVLESGAATTSRPRGGRTGRGAARARADRRPCG